MASHPGVNDLVQGSMTSRGVNDLAQGSMTSRGVNDLSSGSVWARRAQFRSLKPKEAKPEPAPNRSFTKGSLLVRDRYDS